MKRNKMKAFATVLALAMLLSVSAPAFAAVSDADAKIAASRGGGGVTLLLNLNGAEGYSARVQWQRQSGGGWNNVAGATGRSLSIGVNVEARFRAVVQLTDAEGNSATIVTNAVNVSTVAQAPDAQPPSSAQEPSQGSPAVEEASRTPEAPSAGTGTEEPEKGDSSGEADEPAKEGPTEEGEPAAEEPGTEEPGEDDPAGEAEEPEEEEPAEEGEPATEEPGTEEPGEEDPSEEADEPEEEEPVEEGEPAEEEPGTEEPGEDDPSGEAEEPEEEELIEEEEPEEPDYAVMIHSSEPLDSLTANGSMIQLTSTLIGFEGLDLVFQWQYRTPGGDWLDRVGATEAAYSFQATEETVGLEWRLLVSIEDPEEEGEELAEAEEDEQPEASVVILSSLGRVITEGNTVHLSSVLFGLEGVPVRYQWQFRSPGKAWQDRAGANDAQYSFAATPESVGLEWRLLVIYDE